MTAGDVPFASTLHHQCLPHGLFPSLGHRFLRRYLFTYATSPFGLALIVEVDGEPVGFLVGSFDERAHRTHVVREHGTSLALHGAAAMLSRPTVAWRFLTTRLVRYTAGFTRRRLRPPSRVGQGDAEPRTAVLSHVAVVPSVRGIGAGTTLATAFVQRVRATEAETAELLTRDDDRGATGFYSRLGWFHVGDVVDRDGLTWSRLQIELSDG